MKKLRNVLAAITLACGIGSVVCGATATVSDWIGLAKISCLNQDKILASESASDFTHQKNDKIHQLEYDLDQNTITNEEFNKQVNYLNSNQFKRDVVFDLSGVTEQQKNSFKAREQEIKDTKTITNVSVAVGTSLFALTGAGFASEYILEKKERHNKNQENENIM